MNMLEVLDHKILRTITGAHSKVPLEMLYLETGELNISNVISVRRLLYWHNILRRHERELISKVYYAMKEKPIKGDWIELVKADLQKINMTLDQEIQVKQMKKEFFKDIIKERIIKHMHNDMEITKRKHSKVKDVVHSSSGKPQPYMSTNIITGKASSLLLNLRSKCAKGFKDNFKGLYTDNLCPLCGSHIDSQELALTCDYVTQRFSLTEKYVNYEDIFGNVDSQVRISKLFQKVIKLRENLDISRGQDLPTRANIPDPVHYYILGAPPP